jgi:hypothetical protein
MDSAICSSYVDYISITSAIYTDYSLTDSATAPCYVTWVKRTQLPLLAHYSLASDARPQEDPVRCESARSGWKDAKPKTMPKNCHLCYHIVLTVMPFVLYDICRTEDNKPRGSASKISTISTWVFLYVMIYCPLPHPISVKKGWGYHCRKLVWL